MKSILLAMTLLTSVQSFASTRDLSSSCEDKIRALGAAVTTPDVSADPQSVRIEKVKVIETHANPRIQGETQSTYVVTFTVDSYGNGFEMRGTVQAADERFGCTINGAKLAIVPEKN